LPDRATHSRGPGLFSDLNRPLCSGNVTRTLHIAHLFAIAAMMSIEIVDLKKIQSRLSRRVVLLTKMRRDPRALMQIVDRSART